VVGVAAIAGFIQFVVPQLSALGPTLHRLRAGNPKWLGFGVVLEALSLGGYIALFRTVFSCHGVLRGSARAASCCGIDRCIELATESPATGSRDQAASE
jgi:hypothetical protein